MGLSFVEAAGDSSLSQAAAEVRAKLQSSLPEPDTGKLADAPLFASRRDGRAAPFTKVVRRAIREARVLRLDYKDHNEELTDRRVRPLAVWAFTDGWLFAAWCELRRDFRAFRMDRISAIEETGDRFVSSPDQGLQAYLATKFLAARSAAKPPARRASGSA